MGGWGRGPAGLAGGSGGSDHLCLSLPWFTAPPPPQVSVSLGARAPSASLQKKQRRAWGCTYHLLPEPLPPQPLLCICAPAKLPLQGYSAGRDPLQSWLCLHREPGDLDDLDASEPCSSAERLCPPSTMGRAWRSWEKGPSPQLEVSSHGPLLSPPPPTPPPWAGTLQGPLYNVGMGPSKPGNFSSPETMSSL